MFQFLGAFFNRNHERKQNENQHIDSTLRLQHNRSSLRICDNETNVMNAKKRSKPTVNSNPKNKANRPIKNSKYMANTQNNRSEADDRDWRSKRGTYSTLQDYHRATLSTGISKDSVKCPPHIEVEEWLAIHVTDFLDIVTLLFGVIKPSCQALKSCCKTMNAGDDFQYLWQDPKNQLYLHPTIVNAPTYIHLLLIWVSDQLADEQIFPSHTSKPFPKIFLSIVKKIFTRLFRVYGHLYICHIHDIERNGAIAHLNSSFKHFVYFSNEFNLISDLEIVPLRQLYDAILSKPMV